MTDELTGPPAAAGYPARLAIDYPDDGLNRLTTAFRLFMLIPIVLVATLLTGDPADWGQDEAVEGARIVISPGGFLIFPLLLMLLFRRKYPRWWFDWNLELSRFTTRIGAYFLPPRDEYPSTDEHQAVHLDLDYPDAGHDLNRWLPLVKWLLAICDSATATSSGGSASATTAGSISCCCSSSSPASTARWRCACGPTRGCSTSG